MKVMLLTPPYNISQRYSNKLNLKRGYMPPLGLSYIATVLEEQGHKVSILDLQAFEFGLDVIEKKVKDFNPEILGFTALTPTFNKALEIAKYLKEKIGVPVIFGGPHVSCYPEEAIRNNDFIDIVVIGEGEIAAREVIECIEKKKSLKNVRGIVYREGEKIIRTPTRPIFHNLDELPIPSRKFFDMRLYCPLPNQYKVLPVTNMITSRGCSYGQCTYCFEGGRLGHKYRRISPQRAIEEIKMLINEYGIREISFWDDEFVFDRSWVNEFCDLLVKQRIKIKWSCYARVNYVNKETLQKMYNAGCWNIFFGLESGNQESLNKIRKGITLNQTRNAIKWTDEVGIESRGSFMLALPGETPEMGRKTIEFACSLPLDYAQFLATTPFPGTKLFDQCKEEGTLDTDINKYSVFEPVFIPKGYKNKKQIDKLLKQAYKKFYFRPKYIIRHIKNIKSKNDLKKYLSGIKFVLGMT